MKFKQKDRDVLVTKIKLTSDDPYDYWVERGNLQKIKEEIENIRKGLMSLSWLDESIHIVSLKESSEIFRTLDWLYSTIHISTTNLVRPSDEGLEWLGDLRMVLDSKD